MLVFTIGGSRAFDAWTRIGAVVDDASFKPVVIGDAFSLAGLLGMAANRDREPMDVLGEAASTTYGTWLEQRTTWALDELGEFPEDESRYPPIDWDAPEVRLSSTRDVLSGEYLPEVYIAIVPVASTEEIPAYLLYGCFNDNPCPAEHVVVFREWTTRYDAELFSMGEVVEFIVGKPPADWDSALALAREQYVYDYDIVWQGTGDINTLANQLQGAPTWYFWWD